MDWREPSRREFLKALGATVAAAGLPSPGSAAEQPGVPAQIAADRVFVTCADSNTIVVVDPATNAVETTINLTSFDEDPRPPFRLVTAGATASHAEMIHKPLYHGCIGAHGAVPSPDGYLLAICGRGSSNVYLVDTLRRAVVGNQLNPAASPSTSPERVTGGVLVGRDPQQATFTRTGRELWVALRGEDRIAVVDVERALRQSSGAEAGALLQLVPTVQGPSQAWFNAEGTLAFVASQKVPRLDVLRLDPDGAGRSRPRRLTALDVSAQDPAGFTPFLKGSPDGKEIWFAHELADAVSGRLASEPFGLTEAILLGEKARPRQLELVENARGKVVYVALSRVDGDGPDGVASSRIAIVDRGAPPGQRRVVGTFPSHGREAHGLWTNPSHSRLYVAHEQDELPGTPLAGQPVVTAFDVTDPLSPRLAARIPLGSLKLPSGDLRNKRGVGLAYVRPGHRSATG